jgi:hypothetical protein
VGLAAVLASLTRIYTALPSVVSDRWTLLLWTLLGTLPTNTPAAAATSLRAALLTSLRAGTPEQRTQAVTIALRPVQRACCLAPSGSSRPTHWRQGSNGGSGGASARFGALGIGAGGTAEGAAPVAIATSPGSGMLAGFGKGGDKKGELPVALAAAGDRTPPQAWPQLRSAEQASAAVPAQTGAAQTPLPLGEGSSQKRQMRAEASVGGAEDAARRDQWHLNSAMGERHLYANIEEAGAGAGAHESERCA